MNSGRASDDKLIDLARKEIAQLGLVRPEEIEDGTVVRMPKAYPIYQEDYAKQVNVIRRLCRAKSHQFTVGGPERHAQIQQSGPLDDDGAWGGAQHLGRS